MRLFFIFFFKKNIDSYLEYNMNYVKIIKIFSFWNLIINLIY